jgi:hypothetical protein
LHVLISSCCGAAVAGAVPPPAPLVLILH